MVCVCLSGICFYCVAFNLLFFLFHAFNLINVVHDICISVLLAVGIQVDECNGSNVNI